MNEATPEQWLEMWLSEQISIKEWYHILEKNKDVKKLYEKHLEKRYE